MIGEGKILKPQNSCVRVGKEFSNEVTVKIERISARLGSPKYVDNF